MYPALKIAHTVTSYDICLSQYVEIRGNKAICSSNIDGPEIVTLTEISQTRFEVKCNFRKTDFTALYINFGTTVKIKVKQTIKSTASIFDL